MEDFVIQDHCVIAYQGAGSEVTVPEGVVGIAEGAFRRNDALTRVRFPQSLRHIDAEAFAYCRNLAEIYLPEGLETIGASAFRASGLRSLTLPATVRRVGENAFAASALESVVMAGPLASLGTAAFGACLRLTSLRMHGADEVGENVFWATKLRPVSYFCCITEESERDNVAMIWLAGDRREDDDREALASYVRRRRKPLLAKIVRESNLAAFTGMSEAPVKIRFSLDELDDAIDLSTQLGHTMMTAALLQYKHVTYRPATIEAHENDKTDAALGLKPPTLAEWKQIFRIKVNEQGGYTILGYRENAAYVVIPFRMGNRRVTEIAEDAFRGKAMRTVEIPHSVTHVGEYAFAECGDLTSILYSGTMAAWRAMRRESYWNRDTGGYAVTCRDGVIRK